MFSVCSQHLKELCSGKPRDDFTAERIQSKYWPKMLPDVFHIISNVSKYLFQDLVHLAETLENRQTQCETPLALLMRLFEDKCHGQSQFFKSLIDYRLALHTFLSKFDAKRKEKRPHHPMILGGAVHVFLMWQQPFFSAQRTSLLGHRKKWEICLVSSST